MRHLEHLLAAAARLAPHPAALVVLSPVACLAPLLARAAVAHSFPRAASLAAASESDAAHCSIAEEESRCAVDASSGSDRAGAARAFEACIASLI